MNQQSYVYPVISVIIPTYNSEKTIRHTIESVLQQNFSDFELIIINDGSTDSTLEVISHFQDSRIKVFSFDNAGGNVSRNRGLKQAIGEFVSFLDADDLWTPDKLESQLNALKANPQVAVAYSWTDYIDEQGKFLLSGTHITANGNVYEQLLVSNFLENGSNPLIRREALVELGGFDESLTAAQDWDMWLRLAQNFNFIAVPRVQILYRISANSLSTNLARQEKASLQLLDKACSTNTQDLNHLRKKSLTNLYKYLTCKALQQPFNRKKGLAAARFLWKYIFNDSSRFHHTNLKLKLLFKIALIIIFPSSVSTALLTHIKTKL
ncbi:MULTISPECIES: glycosyltransferase [Fischerella]|uniref:glycosyltransferase n=1 Tax=Fischerella TaxID=1190 RepID=UPI00031316FB|nr:MULTISPECIES: glycosyltransferase [Fischerella]MBD2430239.1 glycosyltransferase [Fischerella sp. FACHB-380]